MTVLYYEPRSGIVKALTWTGENTAQMFNFTHGSQLSHLVLENGKLWWYDGDRTVPMFAGDTIVNEDDNSFTLYSKKAFERRYKLLSE